MRSGVVGWVSGPGFLERLHGLEPCLDSLEGCGPTFGTTAETTKPALGGHLDDCRASTGSGIRQSRRHNEQLQSLTQDHLPNPACALRPLRLTRPTTR